MPPKRIVVAMSGGVDSSVTAWLLKQQGHEVIGLFMRSGSESRENEIACKLELPSNALHGLGDQLIAQPPQTGLPLKRHRQGCCSAQDASDARRVADQLDIPFHALDFRDDFQQIKDYFADEYLAGRTPNPCVMCNIWLKFGSLWRFAQQVGADCIATGHYARIQYDASKGLWTLSRARDRSKDQSYVLFGIKPELLPRILLPLGDYYKSQVRELALQAGLNVANKPDSQEICFVTQHRYVEFLHEHREWPDTAGEIVDLQGRVLGHHPGYEHYTVGQRKRLPLTFGEPRYVVAIRPESRQVVIGRRDDLACWGLSAARFQWHRSPPLEPYRCQAQIRSQHQAASAYAYQTADNHVLVQFAEPQLGVAPGQAVVLYDGDWVIGGGWITAGYRYKPIQSHAQVE